MCARARARTCVYDELFGCTCCGCLSGGVVVPMEVEGSDRNAHERRTALLPELPAGSPSKNPYHRREERVLTKQSFGCECVLVFVQEWVCSVRRNCHAGAIRPSISSRTHTEYVRASAHVGVREYDCVCVSRSTRARVLCVRWVYPAPPVEPSRAVTGPVASFSRVIVIAVKASRGTGHESVSSCQADDNGSSAT